jgi:hypothetical protein
MSAITPCTPCCATPQTVLAWAFDHHKHPLAKWLISLDLKGQLPVVRIIEEVSEPLLKVRERAWIRFFKPLGCLLNLNDGDGPGKNVRISELNRQITRARNKLGWSPQQRVNIIKAISHPWSEERKRKWRERPGFQAWREKIIAFNKSRSHTKKQSTNSNLCQQ